MQVFGEQRVNVHALFEQLRREGELTLVGAEAAISENKWKRCVRDAAMCLSGAASAPAAAVQGLQRHLLMQDDIWQWAIKPHTVC